MQQRSDNQPSGWRSTRRDYHEPSAHHPSYQRRPYGGQHDYHSQHGRKKINKRFGLFGVAQNDRRKKQSIPLKSVSVQANVLDYFAQVEVTQRFVNLEENPIETTYTFPIAPNSAVCGFTAEIEGKTIVAEVKETEEAKDAYDDAISSGHGAYLGKEERSDVFTVTVGNLPPGKEATIRITYVAELRLVGNKNKKKKSKGDQLQLLPFEDSEQRLKFALPSRIAPKAKKKQNTYGTQTPVFNRFPEYELAINVNMKTSNPFTGITSTQPIGLSYLGSNEAKIWLSPIIKALKYDFTLLVSLPENQRSQSYAIVESPVTEGGDYGVVFILFPEEFLATAKPDESEKAAEEPKETSATKEEAEKPPASGDAKPEEKPAGEQRRAASELVWEWPSGVQVQQTPLPPTVNQTKGFLLSYCSVPASAFSGAAEVAVTLKGKSAGGVVALTIPVSTKSAVQGNLIHKLFARARIRDLERSLRDKVEEEKKAEVVSLAKSYSLASHYTSFVAVEERTEATEGTMVSRVVPLNAFGYVESQGNRQPRREESTRVERHDNRQGGRGPQQQYGGRSHYDQRGGGDRHEYRGGRDDQDHGPSRSWGDNNRGSDRGGDRGGDRGAREYREDRGDRGARGGRSDRGRGGRGDYRPREQDRRPKTLEVSADLAERLVGIKAKDGSYWNLTSTISEILGVQLTKLVDGLIGFPVSEYVSTIWATAIAVACLQAHPDASKKHSGLIGDALKWLDSETDRHGFEGADKWVKKATEFLIATLN